MIISVTEHYHDYSPQRYFMDTDKLDPKDYVDSIVLKAIKKKSYRIEETIDCSNWEMEPEKFNDKEPEMNGLASFKKLKKGQAVEKELHIRLIFE